MFDVLLASSSKAKSLGFAASTGQEAGLEATVRSLGSGANSLALITGAASGIGRALAHQFWLAGYKLLLIDKNAVALTAVAERYGADAATLDLSQRVDLERISEILHERCPNVVVNCAGIGGRGAIDEIGAPRQLAIFDVNVSALVHITTQAVELFRRRGKGTIINIASSAAFQPLPMMASYAASKSAVLSFSRAVSAELRNTGIHVLTVCPGGTDTNFQESSGVRRLDSEKLVDPAIVAAKIMHAMQRRRSLLIIGSRSYAMRILSALLPFPIQDRLWARLMSKLR
jgi:hypothetical protein